MLPGLTGALGQGVDSKDAAEDIVVENLQAAAVLYSAAMLEQMRLFQVVDRLVERFAQGSLPLGRGPAGELLYQRWKNQKTGLIESDRRALYARIFGAASAGQGKVKPNLDFDALWLRFLDAARDYARHPDAAGLRRSGVPDSHRQETVWRAAVALARNLSRQSYGAAHFAAVDLQREIEVAVRLLEDHELLSAFGARDMWQVVDQVAANELGGARNSRRYRTLASSGAAIIGWLAKYRSVLVAARPVPLLQLKPRRVESSVLVKSPQPRDFSDPELVKAIEQWLAAAASPEKM